ncbi:LamG-like jellyroll fold domain-containing protein [Halalkalibacter sp. AB-rgal2]|uniref:LamG-like jellyroll fold domain-containing protein n=1 Tax=Halalkalibacter sp. AB-rgal2 TaxID=3242695 RepID=UPI00359EB34D
MKRKIVKKSVLLLLMFLLIIPSYSFANDSSGEREIPQFNEASAHDPSIIKVGDTYYAFGTHIDAAKSPDLMRWENFTNGYTTPNNTLFGDLSENLAGSFEWAGEDDADSAGGFAVWAPEVIWNEHYVHEDGSTGAYMMYYSASSTYIRSAIGYAVAKDIEGPYEYVDTIMYSGFFDHEAYDNNSSVNKEWTNTNIPELIEQGVFDEKNEDWFTEDGRYNYNLYTNAIDANLFFDEDGKLWMTYGSWAGGIFILEVDKQTGQPIYPGEDGVTEDGRMIDRYFGTKISGGYGRSGEGPYAVYDEETGYYFLYVTYGWLGADGGYHMRQFRAESPEGPYVDAAGVEAVLPDELDDGLPANRGESFEHAGHGNKLTGNFIFKRDLGEPGTGIGVGYMSPGHNSYYIDDETGKEFNVFHARFPESGEMHQIRVHQMVKNSEQWPVITPHRYAGESVDAVTSDEVSGAYKYINHGKDISAELVESTWVNLEENGTITGAVEGTWELYDDYRVSLTIEGEASSFDGVFLEQWDEVSESWVMTFSALSSDGVTVWGSKAESGSDEDVLSSIKEELNVLIPETVISHLTLPTEAVRGAQIEWASSNEEVISTEGHVNRPEIGDESVELTATISLNDEVAEWSSTVTVLAETEGRLAAYYDFDGQLSDLTGNFEDGTVTGNRLNNEGGQITYEEGVVGDAAYFDGESGIRLPNGLISSSAYSVSFWLNPEELTDFTTTFFGARTENNWVSLVPRGPVGGETMIWSGGSTFYDAPSGTTIETGEWTHVTFTVEDGTITIYLNGEPVFTGDDFPNVFTTTDAEFALGVNYWDIPYQGLMDELIIFDGSALTAEVVEELFENPGSLRPSDEEPEEPIEEDPNGEGTEPEGDGGDPEGEEPKPEDNGKDPNGDKIGNGDGVSDDDNDEKVTNDDEKEEQLGKDGSDGERLPETATNAFNALLIGALLLIMGMLVFMIRRKASVNE